MKRIINTLKKLQILTFTSILIISINANGQQKKIDSLKLVVKEALAESDPDKSDIKAAIILSDHFSKVSFDTAKFYGFAAYDLSKIVGNDTGVAVSLNSIGMMYQICGYFDSAFPYLDSARAMFVTMGDSTGLVFVRNNLAVAMMRRGNYAEALRYYQENLIIAKSRNELENMILSYNNMGITYYDWKKYKQALENYHLALDVLKEMGEEERTGPVYNNIGEAYFDMGEHDTALYHFKEALKVNQKFGKNRSILISMTNIGNIQLSNQDYNKALDVYKEALAISESIPDNVHTAIINIKLGDAYNSMDQYKTAKNHLLVGLNMSLENELINSVLEAYQGLSVNARGLNNAQDVYDYGNLYINLKDSLFNLTSLNKISELETKYKTVEKEKEIVVLKTEQQVKDLEIQLQKNLKYTLGIILLVLIFAAVLLFNRYKLKKEKEKSEIEKARIRIEQRLLHSQMNPHFIFNSLNSINSFIGENNTTEAQVYLTKFARLMRLILENSRKVTVALIDEIQALKLNLELEQLRFDNRFEFKIDVDPDIDPEDIYIPPMLIQPFIENAIKHGIKGREDKGLITLSILAEDEVLVCIVEDNGVGRELTQKGKLGDHISLGTQVTIERLEILRQEKNERSSIEIIDLKDEKGIGIGTKIILIIPFEQD